MKKTQKELRVAGYKGEFTLEDLVEACPELTSIVWSQQDKTVGTSTVLMGKRYFFRGANAKESVAQAVIHKLHELRS